MRKSHHSLHGLLRQSLLRSVVCMILPVCVLAGLLVVLTQRYGADIALTTRASEVRTVLVQDLPDEVWNVVSGRISFEDGRQRMLIDSALHELNDMLDSAGEDEAQYLNAALRAIRTIDSYVDQLETQMEAGAAVSRNESLYREIHSVGHLAGSMLDRYIENEIARMGRFNARIQHGLGAAALALIVLVGVMVWLTIRASDNLEGAIGASLRQLEQFANRIAAGELTEPRKAILPIVAAAGGALMPALVYLALNWGGEFQGGWGVSRKRPLKKLNCGRCRRRLHRISCTIRWKPSSGWLKRAATARLSR